METHRFNVFGRIYIVQRSGDTWKTYLSGADGKRGPAGVEIPEFIKADEIAQFLFDMFHEQATPTNGDVFKID